MESARDLASNAIVFLTFLTLLGGAFAWFYRKVMRPVAIKVEKILTLTEYELKPNGGGSLADKIDQIAINHAEAQVHWEELGKQNATLTDELKKHRDDVNKRLEKIERATATPRQV